MRQQLRRGAGDRGPCRERHLNGHPLGPMPLVKYTPFFVAALFAALFGIERFFPLRHSRITLIGRVLINLALSALSFLVALLFVKPCSLRTLEWTSRQSFGLLHLIAVPSQAAGILGFLLLDLSFFYWHVLNHKVPLLWRFHNVHHIDPALDVSTGFRFHFGEVLFSTFFRVAQVSLIGLSLTTFAAYELIFQANTLFHHSNVRLPIRLERLLNAILVTPRMHGIHHSQVRRETNSNFGVVFCWWDKLHRTIGLNIPQSEIEIGIAGYSSSQDNGLWRALTLPFRKQRDYWSKSDGTVPRRDAALLPNKSTWLAE
jgi:sterol desaturase/sphingolipid hydroxylase (fatty acid hydroxylase superfamily)